MEPTSAQSIIVDCTQGSSELPPEFQKLSTLLEDSPETLALGNQEIQAAALNAVKHIFDLSVQSEVSSRPHIGDLLTSLAPSLAPQTRSKMKTEAQKPSANGVQKDLFEFTPLKSLFVDNMDEEQVWAQLDLRTKTICRMLDFVLEGESEEQNEQMEDSSEEEEDNDDGKLRKVLEALEGNEDVDMDEILAKYGFDDGSEDSQDEEQSYTGSELDEEVNEDDAEEGISPLRDLELDEADEEINTEQSRSSSLKSISHSSRKKKGKSATSELDDGFFNLAEFNADTERAESKSSSKGHLAGDDDSEDENMDIDLFANVDFAENFDEEDLENNGGELYYRDFFEPPSRSSAMPTPHKQEKTNVKTKVRFNDQVRVKEIKATGKNRSLHDDSDEEEEDDEGFFDDEDNEDSDEQENEEEEELDTDSDHQGSEEESEESEKHTAPNMTMERLKHDLFAEEDEDPQDDMTTYQRRMAALKEQIAELESENVAPKEWTLMGEAGTRQRPQNSLLEEDLEFERIMKAVPVTTEKSVRTLEETIKARILEGRFDDVVRIRLLEDKPFLPSKFFELQDSKSSQSLAQIYESEYVASQEGGTLPDDRDGKLKKEHEDINALWENICGKLDALCNAHFVPKLPKATISTVTNTATATLESALPTTKSTSTMLAPEEVFSASPSSSRARSELTPAEKRALHTKERKTKKRQRDALDKSVDKFAKAKGIGSVKKQKQAALDSIVKHGKGVTVVGKKGITDSKTKHKH
ncbi:U3 small nucleolar ribonucleoprotein complex, subunit Mpp10 [Flammula alnicola]|nr:U3 small nucleolar ribonucleoprotein complex, subunit Mpp10 [Flammula alnicola]